LFLVILCRTLPYLGIGQVVPSTHYRPQFVFPRTIKEWNNMPVVVDQRGNAVVLKYCRLRTQIVRGQDG